jgi:hypothetical protein
MHRGGTPAQLLGIRTRTGTVRQRTTPRAAAHGPQVPHRPRHRSPGLPRNASHCPWPSQPRRKRGAGDHARLMNPVQPRHYPSRAGWRRGRKSPPASTAMPPTGMRPQIDCQDSVSTSAVNSPPASPVLMTLLGSSRRIPVSGRPRRRKSPGPASASPSASSTRSGASRAPAAAAARRLLPNRESLGRRSGQAAQP